MNTSTQSSSNKRDWSIKEIRDLVQSKFGKRPCWFQIKIALALHAGKDVIGCAPTGAGKTLSFWIPLLMALEEGQDKMSIVVTPLNLLGRQNQASLDKAGLPAIAINKDNANAATWKDIEDGKYRVIIINPEILMGNEELEKLWKKPKVTKRILNFIFDEGHCISQWGSFRKEYLHVGALRYLIPECIPFYVASATLPLPTLLDIIDILKLREGQTEHILRSNDRPEIKLVVQGLVFAANSFRDLDFLIPEGFSEGDPIPDKFLVFFDSKKEAENACKYLRKRLLRHLRKKLKWFHADLTQEGREKLCEQMRDDEVWGMFCTDAFGMGMDLPDIKIIVQWKATCDLLSLWQRFGRAARGQGQTGTAILLVEKKDTNEERALKAEKAAKKKVKANEGIGTKRKATHQLTQQGKRPALADRNIASTSAIEIQSDSVVADLDEVDMAEDLLKEERRKHYARRVRQEITGSTLKGKAKERAVVVGSAMDDFINAHFNCRRIVPMLFFGNDKRPVNDHILCDTTSHLGCTRCKPKETTICCDLCDPEAVDMFEVQTPEKASKAPGKSSIKQYAMTPLDHNLQTALFDWRDDQATVKFNASVLETFGSGLLLSDEIITRIIDCAQASKLSTVPHLIKETGWREDWATEFGDSLLSVVLKYRPIAAYPETSTRTRGTVTCSACGTKGHNSSNKSCPVRVAAASLRYQPLLPEAERPTDENTAPNPLPKANPPRPRPRPRPIPQAQPSMISQPPPMTTYPAVATPYQVPPYYQHILQPTFIQQPPPQMQYYIPSRYIPGPPDEPYNTGS